MAPSPDVQPQVSRISRSGGPDAPTPRVDHRSAGLVRPAPSRFFDPADYDD